MTDLPTPEAIGFEHSADTPRANAERAIALLDDHTDGDGVAVDVAEGFVSRYVRGLGAEHARAILDDPASDARGAKLSAALFMGGDSPYAATPDETREHLRDGAGSTSGAGHVMLPTGGIPLAHLDAIGVHERGTRARQRGEDWPTTEQARERLFNTLADIIRHEDDRVVDAPTSLGKTHTVAATRWGARDDITGGRPVVHLLETRDARDEAIEIAEQHGGSYLVLRSRREACPVAAGAHDDDVTVDGTPASEWLEAVCEGRGVPFSAAHRHLERHHDGPLPCQSGGPCDAIDQWRRYREGDHALVIATHNFAFAPGVRMDNNIVIDEQPDFANERLTTDRVRRAVGAYLRAIDAPVSTWEAFIQLARHDGYDGDAAAERDALGAVLDEQPDREWYFTNPDAHTLAPALARAIFNAEERANGRRAGRTPHEPPRLEANAREAEGWNREWVSVVLDDTNEICTVRVVPDLGVARSVIGLDAHPALPVWQANTVPWIERARVLDSDERRRWRQHERGLRVVQVGDATRPLASGRYFDHTGTRAVVEQLAERYGQQFRTAITAASVEDQLRDILDEFVTAPETMHYGEERSRNDYAGERVGLVNGCIDPGDDYILDLLAELDLNAEPETTEDGDGETHRAHGRGFVGEDAEAAAAILASVRENHTAQAAGRYARDPDDPEDHATVFVRTDAMPPGFADIQVPGAVWTPSKAQEQVVETLRDSPTTLTARDIAERTGLSKRSVLRTLKRLAEHGVVDAIEGAGDHGATLYADSGLPHAGIVDLGDEDLDEIATFTVWDSHTWTVAVSAPDVPESGAGRATPTTDHADGGLWRWTDPPTGTG